MVIAMLRRAWNDSVWSKVIAAGITAAIAAIGAFAMKPLEATFEVGRTALTRTVQVPAWLALGSLVLLAVLIAAVSILWRRKAVVDNDADTQPNAVPVTLLQTTRPVR